MINGTLVRGTTPTQTFPLNNLTTSDLADFTIAYRQKGRTVLIKRKSEIEEELDNGKMGGSSINITLTQSDTLIFNPNIQIVEVQIKGLLTNGSVLNLGNYRFRLEDVFDEEEFEGVE